MSHISKQQKQQIVDAALNVAVEKLLETEKKLDEAIEHLDNLTADETMELRQRRKHELAQQQEKKIEWLKLGHGRYEEIHDQNDWFEQCKSSQRFICHFFRPTTQYCDLLDEHLRKIAPDHLESRIIKINAERAEWLSEKLNITIMPTIVITLNSKIVDVIEGFTELGNTDAFTTDVLEQRLAKNGGLIYDADAKRLAQQRHVQQEAVRQSNLSKLRSQALENDDDDDWLNDE